MNINAPDFDQILSQLPKQLKKRSKMQQLTIGISIGLTAGWLVKKIGKMTALGLGGGLILLQLANDQGIICINWDRLEKNIEENLAISDSTGNIIDWTKSKFEHHSKMQSNFLMGTVGGFFLGLGF